MEKNHSDELYFIEQCDQIRYAYDRIRHFVIMTFFITLIIVNYTLTPSFLWYPWILLLFTLYTAYRLIYPLSITGHFGEKRAQQAMIRLKKEVDKRNEEIEKIRREHQVTQ